MDEIHILWTSEGLSCDGDSVSVTAAMQPSLEDVVLGLIPGLPKVHLHNKVLAYELGGEEFMAAFHQAARGELEPFVLVVEGSIPNENINGDGYWTSMGNDPATGEPITVNTWIDRLAPRALAVVAIGTCATYGGIHAMAGNPTGAMGLCDYLGWNFKAKAGIPIVNVPGCPVQPDNFMETLTWLLYQAAGLSPMIPLDDMHRPTWLFGKTVHEGCSRAAYYEQADFAEDYNSPIILSDYPQVAPESLGDLFDGTEVDQLLLLNTLTLTDEEKAEMRATDPRAREILERAESLTGEDLVRMHGTIRDFQVLRPPSEADTLLWQLERPQASVMLVDAVELDEGWHHRPDPSADLVAAPVSPEHLIEHMQAAPHGPASGVVARTLRRGSPATTALTDASGALTSSTCACWMACMEVGHPERRFAGLPPPARHQRSSVGSPSGDRLPERSDRWRVDRDRCLR